MLTLNNSSLDESEYFNGVDAAISISFKDFCSISN